MSSVNNHANEGPVIITDGNFHEYVNYYFDAHDQLPQPLQTISIGQWDTSHVTDMSCAFDNRSDFNEDLSGWNVDRVTVFDYMFFGASKFCQNLRGWKMRDSASVVAMFMYSGMKTILNYPAHMVNHEDEQLITNLEFKWHAVRRGQCNLYDYFPAFCKVWIPASFVFQMLDDKNQIVAKETATCEQMMIHNTNPESKNIMIGQVEVDPTNLTLKQSVGEQLRFSTYNDWLKYARQMPEEMAEEMKYRHKHDPGNANVYIFFVVKNQQGAIVEYVHVPGAIIRSSDIPFIIPDESVYINGNLVSLGTLATPTNRDDIFVFNRSPNLESLTIDNRSHAMNVVGNNHNACMVVEDSSVYAFNIRVEDKHMPQVSQVAGGDHKRHSFRKRLPPHSSLSSSSSNRRSRRRQRPRHHLR